MKLYKVKDLINTTYENKKFVLPGLPLGKVGILHSIGGVGKSFWALQACFQACASGSCDFEFNAIAENAVSFGGKVAYLSFEDEADDFGRRAQAFAKSNLSDRNKTAWIRDISEIFDFAFFETAVFRENLATQNLEIDAELQAYLNGLSRSRVSLIVFDTLSRVHYLDENSNKDMSKLITLFEQIARNLNCAVLILHHDNKAGISSFHKDEAQNASSIRGASALASNVRWHASLRTMSQFEIEDYNIDEDERRNYLRIELDKTSYSAPIGGSWLKRTDGGILKAVQLKKVSKKNGGDKNYGY